MSTAAFTAGLSASLKDYVRVSPDGEKHWPAVAAKTKELWSTWTVLRPEDLRTIQAPVLVMAGDRDLIPLEHTIEIFRALPKGQVCILPGTGHETMRERPEDFNRLTREFLEGTGAR
jgi:pimeloyl-ACP methyl ester carboxylesterase